MRFTLGQLAYRVAAGEAGLQPGIDARHRDPRHDHKAIVVDNFGRFCHESISSEKLSDMARL
ncbi:MAG: hypothetical protein OEO19_16675 [Gammaproteobacteria bacterium]|nr:hypothetical protein [Gammaproteobacteria bacterium]MDH3449381.1 hypothetical protein [Gammaproteobacteria bacterium]